MLVSGMGSLIGGLSMDIQFHNGNLRQEKT